MQDECNLTLHIGQQPENNILSSSYQVLRTDELELTDDEKIDKVAARILEAYKDAFLELEK